MINNNSFFLKKKDNFMETQNLEQTEQAISRLKESVSTLSKVVDVKRAAIAQKQEAYHNNMAEKARQIEELRKALNMAAQKIGESVENIDEVIRENGSGNNSN